MVPHKLTTLLYQKLGNERVEITEKISESYFEEIHGLTVDLNK